MAKNMQRRLLSALVLVGFSLLSTPVRAEEAQSESADVGAVNQLVQQSSTLPLTIEETFQQSDDVLIREYRFIGNANDIVLFNTEWRYPFIPAMSELYDKEGNLVSSDDFSPLIALSTLDDSIFESEAFRLPTAGEYTLVLTFSPDISDFSEAENLELAIHASQLRVATDYEQAMLQFHNRFERQQFEEALSFLGRAVEQTLHLPDAYIWRPYTYLSMATGGRPLDDDEFYSTEGLHRLYSRYSEDIQSLIISDLRRASEMATALIETEEAWRLEYYEPELLTQIADLFETGEPSPELVEYFSES